MRKLVFAIIFFFSLFPLFSQNRMRLDDVIKDFAGLITSYDTGTIAVLRLLTEKPSLEDYFIDNMMARIIQSGGLALERRHIDIIKSEIDFAMSGYVTDQIGQAPWIGHLRGANTVIYGTFIKGASLNRHRMTVSAATAETGVILLSKSYELIMDSQLANLLEDRSAQLWTLGISAGSSFSQPLIIGTIRGTIAPFRYTFMELGVDAGILNRRADEEYFSVCPYANFALYLPLDIGGLYIGAGLGYWFSQISNPDENITERKILANAIIGVNILDRLDVSYTLRTNFAGVTNKFSIGWIHRFR
jgi:hypothetical protein